MELWQSTTYWCYCRLLGNRSSVIQLFLAFFALFRAKMLEKRAFLRKNSVFKNLRKPKAPLVQGFLFATILRKGEYYFLSLTMIVRELIRPSVTPLIKKSPSVNFEITSQLPSEGVGTSVLLSGIKPKLNQN